MVDQPIPFWRKLAEAVGLSEPELPARTAAQAPPAAPGAGRPAPPTPPTPPTPAAPAGSADPADETDVEPEPVPVHEAEVLLDLWFAREDDVETAWRQCVPGPGVAEIATRLSLVPPAFLADPVAILPLAEHILEVEYGAKLLSGADLRAQRVLATADQVRSTGSSAARRGAALALWLWASDDLHGPLSVPLSVVARDRALAALAFRLASVVDPAEWVRDADRRDEAARQFLFWSGHLPADEDEATARSILAMRDSLQQNAALAQTLADHEHRLEVSRRLQQARAREAAARYSSE
ncbi:hypothetical protein [Cryobacterium sp. AP23]